MGGNEAAFLMFTVCVLSRVRWCSLQAPLSMGFSRQEYWSGLPYPSPGDLPDPGIEATFLALAGGFFPTATLKSHVFTTTV